MNSRSIKVIFFDAAGTLFHVKGSVGQVYLQYAEKYGVTSTDETIAAVNAAFKQAFREAPSPVFAVDRPANLKQCERLWWFDIVHAVFYRVGMFEGFDDYFDEVYEAFAGAKHWELYPETVSVLRQLKTDGYELGVITNFDTRFFGILKEIGLHELFDSITLSSLAGAAKPAPQIFQYALEHHAMEPQEAVHVGDSVQEDFEGATGADLHAILLNRDDDHSLSETRLSIRSLEELPSLVTQF